MPTSYDKGDLDTMALCMWKEARGQGIEGMHAVGHVILNRALKWYSNDLSPIHSSVYAKNQFTSMSVPSDPQFNLEPADDDKQYSQAQTLASGILNGTDSDPTHGALYYANLQYATSGWFFENIVSDTDHHPQTAVIGQHTFFA